MKKKGFTLIELLAVIVILAIIMVIAIPQILNVIENSRKSAAKSSALGYIKAIDYNNKFADMNQPGYIKITSSDVSGINVSINGDKPTSGTVTINEAGKVSSASLCILEYTVTYNGSSATVGNKCGGTIPENPDYVVTEAGTLICTLYGRQYTKLNDGKAYAAYFYMQENNNPVHTHLILVSEDEDAVEYNAGGGNHNFSSNDSIEYNGKTYYISNSSYCMKGSYTSTGGFAQKLSTTPMTRREAAELLLDTVFGN